MKNNQCSSWSGISRGRSWSINDVFQVHGERGMMKKAHGCSRSTYLLSMIKQLLHNVPWHQWTHQSNGYSHLYHMCLLRWWWAQLGWCLWKLTEEEEIKIKETWVTIIVRLNYRGIVEWLVNAIDSQNLSLEMPSHNYHPWKSSKCLDTRVCSALL